MKISAMNMVFFKNQKLRSEDPIRLFSLSLVGVSFSKFLKFKAPYNMKWFIMSQILDLKDPIELVRKEVFGRWGLVLPCYIGASRKSIAPLTYRICSVSFFLDPQGLSHL